MSDNTTNLGHASIAASIWAKGICGTADSHPAPSQVTLPDSACAGPARMQLHGETRRQEGLTSNNLAKDRVLVIQVVGALVQDEELGPVGVLARIGHAEHAPP